MRVSVCRLAPSAGSLKQGDNRYWIPVKAYDV